MERTKIKAVLLGLGNMGRHHYRYLCASPDFELVAVVDPTPRHAIVDPSIPLLSTPEELDRFEFDAAIVATPTETHTQMVKDLLRKKVHVLVEKPAAANFEEADMLVKLARDQEVGLAVGHIERCNPGVDAVASLLDLGVLGMPVHAYALRSGPYPNAVRPGNQVFLDLAVHELDVLQRLFHKVRVMSGFYHCTREEEIADLAEIQLEVGEGIQTLLHVNWLSPRKIRSLKVTGTAGVCEMDYISQSVKLYGVEASALEESPYQFTPLEDPHCVACELDIAKVEPIGRQLAEFARLIRGEGNILCRDFEILESLQTLDDCVRKSGASLTPYSAKGWVREKYIN